MEEGLQQDQSQVSCPITQEVPTELVGEAMRARPGEGPVCLTCPALLRTSDGDGFGGLLAPPLSHGVLSPAWPSSVGSKS